jgi:hypothetical protein
MRAKIKAGGHASPYAPSPAQRHRGEGDGAARRRSFRAPLQHVWDIHFDPTTNIIDVYGGRVRRKIDDGQVR